MVLKFNNKKKEFEERSHFILAAHRKYASAGVCLLGFPLRWFEPTLPIVRLRKMGNQKKGTAVERKGLLFSAETKDLEQFRTVMHNNLEEKDLEWMSLAAQAIAKVFQNIVAERTAKSATTPMQTDLNTFSAIRFFGRRIAHYFHSG